MSNSTSWRESTTLTVIIDTRKRQTPKIYNYCGSSNCSRLTSYRIYQKPRVHVSALLNRVMLFWELSHSRAMSTSPHATVPAPGHTPKMCPYSSLVHTPSENYYFSLT